MKAYAYRAQFESGDRRGNIVVSFPDVPEAITQGRGEADARSMAEEALGLVLLSYLQRGKALPKPRAKGRGLIDIAVAPDVAAKLAVLKSSLPPASPKANWRAASVRTKKRCAGFSIRSIRPNCPRSLRRCARSASGWSSG